MVRPLAARVVRVAPEHDFADLVQNAVRLSKFHPDASTHLSGRLLLSNSRRSTAAWCTTGSSDSGMDRRRVIKFHSMHWMSTSTLWSLGSIRGQSRATGSRGSATRLVVHRLRNYIGGNLNDILVAQQYNIGWEYMDQPGLIDS